MILSKCFYVSYSVADFSADGEPTCHEDTYQNYNNALLVAKELVKCLDVVNDVYVIDGLTGEILDTVSKAAANENEVEEDSIPTFTDTFEDKNGGIWRLLEMVNGIMIAQTCVAPTVSITIMMNAGKNAVV